MNQYLAVTSNGLENLLVEELTQLGISDAKPVQAGVKFKASNEQIYRCCLWSRLASRFVRVITELKRKNFSGKGKYAVRGMGIKQAKEEHRIG